MKVVPKGWLKYDAMGEPVAGTRMIPFKVPLNEDICCSRVPNDKWFTPAILLQRQPGLKTIIDLTDTTRYYDPQEFSQNGVAHVKIRITGGGMLPPLRKLRLFFRTVDEFMKKYADDPDALVGVHCTHGLNRTGYFICHYMVDRLDMSPDDAIAKFQAARGHIMHRVNYIHEIKNSKGKLEREESQDTDTKKLIQYSSPLGDALDDYANESSRRGYGSKPWRTTTDDNWRKPRDTSPHRNFRRNDSTSKTFSNCRYDDKSRHNREKRFSRGEQKGISTHPYEKETSRASSSKNWRDRP